MIYMNKLTHTQSCRKSTARHRCSSNKAVKM